MSNSKTPRTVVAGVIAAKLDRIPTAKLGTEIAAYLLSENRAYELDSLLRDIQQRRAESGVVEVAAVSARPLSDAARRDIETRVRRLYPDAADIIIDEQIDPGVVGGVRLELANEQLDLSVRAKLNHFKQLTANRS